MFFHMSVHFWLQSPLMQSVNVFSHYLNDNQSVRMQIWYIHFKWGIHFPSYEVLPQQLRRNGWTSFAFLPVNKLLVPHYVLFSSPKYKFQPALDVTCSYVLDLALVNHQLYCIKSNAKWSLILHDYGSKEVILSDI